MRRALLETLTEFAAADDRVILIVGDVGFSFMEAFQERFPNQFLNAGVTEQTFMGLAAGMASAGWKPWLYSMIPFVTMRNYEQLRNDVCCNNANVKVIGVRGSVHYKFLGFSHNLLVENEDKRILEHLPNLTLRFPETPADVVTVAKEAYTKEGPFYIRL